MSHQWSYKLQMLTKSAILEGYFTKNLCPNFSRECTPFSSLPDIAAWVQVPTVHLTTCLTLLSSSLKWR